jgi:AhpC/TSA family
MAKQVIHVSDAEAASNFAKLLDRVRGMMIVKKPFLILGLAILTLASPIGSRAAVAPHPTVIFDGKTTQLSESSPIAPSADLWVTLDDLTRATGFVVKPEGVCRKELCFPLPKNRKAEFLVKRGNAQWFNLSAFARLLHQPVAHDDALSAWYFGPRPEVQNNYLGSLEAPNFTLPDMDGRPHSLADFRGKKVLIITWASW